LVGINKYLKLSTAAASAEGLPIKIAALLAVLKEI
jgi:hypothetical protein